MIQDRLQELELRLLVTENRLDLTEEKMKNLSATSASSNVNLEDFLREAEDGARRARNLIMYNDPGSKYKC